MCAERGVRKQGYSSLCAVAWLLLSFDERQIYIYIYIYTDTEKESEKERERERERQRERERERETHSFVYRLHTCMHMRAVCACPLKNMCKCPRSSAFSPLGSTRSVVSETATEKGSIGLLTVRAHMAIS